VPSGEVEVVRADPVLRRQILLVMVAVIAIGGLGLEQLPASLQVIFRLARESPAAAEREAQIMMVLLLGPMILGGFFAGIATIRTSVDALRTRRFPPPGARVFRDTPVIRGLGARIVGTVALVLGATLVCASAGLTWFGYRAAAELRKGCPRASTSGGTGAATVTRQPSVRQRTSCSRIAFSKPLSTARSFPPALAALIAVRALPSRLEPVEGAWGRGRMRRRLSHSP
jgi:hypothetical protein